MGGTGEGVGQADRGGLSRRQMIKASAVAGAVAWTAPVIFDSLSSPAAARTLALCGDNVATYSVTFPSLTTGGLPGLCQGPASTSCIGNSGGATSGCLNTHCASTPPLVTVVDGTCNSTPSWNLTINSCTDCHFELEHVAGSFQVCARYKDSLNAVTCASFHPANFAQFVCVPKQLTTATLAAFASYTPTVCGSGTFPANAGGIIELSATWCCPQAV